MPIRRHHGDRHKRDPAAQTVWPEPGKYRGEFDDDGDDGDDDDDDDDDDDYDDNDIYIYFDDDDIYVGDVGGSGQLGIPSEPSNQSCSLAAPLIGPVWRLSDRRKKPKKTMPSEIPSMGHPHFPLVVFVICPHLPELMIHRIYVCVSFKHCQQRHNGPKG